jgi:DNA-directed RNA polymerase specialized sigma24 family protein
LKPGIEWTDADRDAAAACLYRQLDRAITVSYAIVRNWDMAEDVVDEAFVVWARKYREFDPGRASQSSDCPLWTWFKGIVIRLSLQARRKALRMVPLPLDGSDGLEAPLPVENLPTRDLERLDQVLQSRLSPEERCHLQLRLRLESSAEVAYFLDTKGIEQGTEAVRWSRLRDKLRKLVKKVLGSEVSL